MFSVTVSLPGLLDSEDGGIILLWNIGNYLPSSLVEHPRRFESLSLQWEPRVSQVCLCSTLHTTCVSSYKCCHVCNCQIMKFCIYKWPICIASLRCCFSVEIIFTTAKLKPKYRFYELTVLLYLLWKSFIFSTHLFPYSMFRPLIKWH